MIIGYLAIGFLCAVMSAIMSLTVGFGLLAMLGFYILGGVLGTIGTACLAAYVPKARNAADPRAEGLVGKV